MSAAFSALPVRCLFLILKLESNFFDLISRAFILWIVIEIILQPAKTSKYLLHYQLFDICFESGFDLQEINTR